MQTPQGGIDQDAASFMHHTSTAIMTHASITEGISHRISPAALSMKQAALTQHFSTTGKGSVLSSAQRTFLSSLSPDQREALVSRITRRAYELREQQGDDRRSLLAGFVQEHAERVQEAAATASSYAGSVAGMTEEEGRSEVLGPSARGSPATSPFHLTAEGRFRPSPAAASARFARWGSGQHPPHPATHAMITSPQVFSPISRGAGRRSQPPPSPARRPPAVSSMPLPRDSAGRGQHLRGMILAAAPHEAVNVYGQSRGAGGAGGAASSPATPTTQVGAAARRPGVPSHLGVQHGVVRSGQASTGLAKLVQAPIAGVGETPADMVRNPALRRASMFNATGKWQS